MKHSLAGSCQRSARSVLRAASCCPEPNAERAGSVRGQISLDLDHGRLVFAQRSGGVRHKTLKAPLDARGFDAQIPSFEDTAEVVHLSPEVVERRAAVRPARNDNMLEDRNQTWRRGEARAAPGFAVCVTVRGASPQTPRS
jgi:hypothetical protein